MITYDAQKHFQQWEPEKKVKDEEKNSRKLSN